jgi:hypothetical protein
MGPIKDRIFAGLGLDTSRINPLQRTIVHADP